MIKILSEIFGKKSEKSQSDLASELSSDLDIEELLEHNNDSILICNQQLEITYSNKAFAALFGFRPNASEKFSILKIFPIEERTIISHHLDSLLSGRERTKVLGGKFKHVSILTNNGANHEQVFVKIRAVRRSTNQLNLVFYISRVDQQIVSTKLFADLQGRMETILASMSDLLFILDNNRIFQSVNKPNNPVLLFPQEVFLQKSIYEISFPSDIISKFDFAFNQIDQGVINEEVEYSLPFNNTLCWFKADFTALNDSENNKVGYLVSIKDITESRKRLQLIEQQGAFFEFLSKINNRLINVPIRETDSVIANSLHDVQVFFDIHACAFYQLDAAGVKLQKKCAIESHNTFPNELSSEAFFLKQDAKGYFLQTSVQSNPIEGFEIVNSLQSRLFIPIWNSGSMLGFFVFEYAISDSQTQLERVESIRICCEALGNYLIRKLRDEKIYELNSILQQALSVTKSSVWEIAIPDLTIINYDNRFLKIYDVPDTFIASKLNDIQQLIHPEDAEKTVQFFKKAIHEKRNFHHIHRIITPNGKEKLVEVYTVYVDSMEDKSAKLILISRDVSEMTDWLTQINVLESRFLNFFEYAGNYRLICDSDGYITHANQMFRNAIPTIVGKKIWYADFTIGSDLFSKQLESYFERCAKGEVVNADIEAHIGNEPNQFYNLIMIPVILNQQLDSVIVEFTDRTEQRRLELKSITDESKFRAVFNASNDMEFLVDADGILVEVNDAVRDIIGDKDFIGKPFTPVLFETHPAEIRVAMIDGFMKAKEGVTSKTQVDAVMHQKMFSFILTCRPIFDQFNQLRFVFINALNISELKAVQSRLEQAEQDYRTIVENIPSMIMLFDRDHRCLFANGPAKRWMHHESGDLQELTLQQLFSNDYARQLAQIQDEVFRTNREIQQILHRDSQGNTDILDSVFIPVSHRLMPDKQLVMLVQTNITELFNSQMQVQEKVKQLNHIAWIQSHVIRRPLSNIMNIADLIRLNEKDTDKMLEFLKSEVHELDEIVTEIINSSNSVN